MHPIDVMILDETLSATDKRAIAASVAGALAALHPEHAPGFEWRIIARRARTAPEARASTVAQAQPGIRLAALDYPSWHAHLAGPHRVGSGISRRTTS